jgi:hypothetical protein
MPPTIKRIGDILLQVTSYEQLEQIVRDRGLQRRAAHEMLVMVNGGRWLTLCPVCNNGVPCDPDWSKTICIDCGTVLIITFPEDWQAIERALVERPIANQNWLPGESVEQLVEENREHGMGGVS